MELQAATGKLQFAGEQAEVSGARKTAMEAIQLVTGPFLARAKAGRFKALAAHLKLADLEGRSGFPLSQTKVKTEIDELNNLFEA